MSGEELGPVSAFGLFQRGIHHSCFVLFPGDGRQAIDAARVRAKSVNSCITSVVLVTGSNQLVGTHGGEAIPFHCFTASPILAVDSGEQEAEALNTPASKR